MLNWEDTLAQGVAAPDSPLVWNWECQPESICHGMWEMGPYWATLQKLLCCESPQNLDIWMA